jgi:hypothetical protein
LNPGALSRSESFRSAALELNLQRTKKGAFDEASGFRGVIQISAGMSVSHGAKA